MAKTTVRILRSFTHEIPETQLEVNGVPTMTVPGKTISYNKGDVHEFRSKRDAAAFVAAHGKDKAQVLPPAERMYARPPRGFI